ncbi:MAG: ATP-binding protein [Planctomycetaceae bacterium]|nr:ATP-binding protein [Planctomycetaceae bacterium]
MKPSELIGKVEGPLLEFKAAEVLKDPRKVAREVVAMLNASNGRDVGEIWIGVGETASKASALHGVPEAELQRARLRDSLVDTIEPMPRSEEVAVTVVSQAGLQPLIRIEVLSAAVRKPFALLKDGARHYYVRVQDRTSVLAYDELRSAWQVEARVNADRPQGAMARLSSYRSAAVSRDGSRLWIGVAPHEDLQLSLDDESVQALLLRPSATGNREEGWNHVRPFMELKVFKDGRQTGDLSWGLTKLRRNGDIEFDIPVERLRLTSGDRHLARNELHPYALLEYPTSIVRLAGKLAKLGRSPWFSASLMLTRIRGWQLWPYAPDLMGWRVEPFGVGEYDEADDLTIERIDFSREELAGNADACAYRIVKQIYEAFHLEPSKIPRVFDPNTGRLNLE